MTKKNCFHKKSIKQHNHFQHW